MSACAAVFHLDGKTAERIEINTLLGQMAYRGGDGVFRQIIGNVAMGFQHLCVLPEDKGSDWPLWDREQRICLVFDGRLDNRGQLIRELGLPSSPRRDADAQLVLHGYQKWGDYAFERFVGPFSLILFEPGKQSMILARDALGDRRLCYAYKGKTLLIASDEQAILTYPGIRLELNKPRIATYFADRRPTDDETYFKGIYHLPPAHSMRITPERVDRRQYWQVKRSKDHWRRKPEEIEEEFRYRLTKVVRAQSRGVGRPATLLSGGIDSSSIVAAAMNSPANHETKPACFSFVFDNYPESDERQFLNDIYSRFDLEFVQIKGDKYWPLRDDACFTHHNIDEIVLDRIAGIVNKTLDAIRERGYRTVIAGVYGDQLFDGYSYWLRDLVATGEFRKAISGFNKQCRSTRSARSEIFNAIRRLLPFNGWRRYGKSHPSPEWLTERAKTLLSPQPGVDPLVGVSWQQDRFEHAVNLDLARMSSHWHSSVLRWGLDLRFPYRDRSLVEFVLNLPAFYFFDPVTGFTRPLVRNGFRGILPDSVVDRVGKAGYSKLVRKGLYDKERSKVEKTLLRGSGEWKNYVDEFWLTNSMASREPIGSYILWLCLSYEKWRKALNNIEKTDTNTI